MVSVAVVYDVCRGVRTQQRIAVGQLTMSLGGSLRIGVITESIHVVDNRNCKSSRSCAWCEDGRDSYSVNGDALGKELQMLVDCGESCVGRWLLLGERRSRACSFFLHKKNAKFIAVRLQECQTVYTTS